MNKNQELRGANCHNGLACNQTGGQSRRRFAPWGGRGGLRKYTYRDASNPSSQKLYKTI